PTYRDSDNRGSEYMAAIIGHAGAGPGRDVMAGVAMLRKRSYVDPKRTAVTGWSYGGYMTSWLISNYPEEWQAAKGGGPGHRLGDQYNYGEGSILVRYLFGGSPWVDGRIQAYRDQSPITYATKIKTPTLVM